MTEDYRDRPRLGLLDDVTRYVGGSHYDPTTGKLNASAFDRNLKDHDGLSVNKTFVFDAEIEADRAKLRTVAASRMKSKALGKSAVFIEINVGDALEALNDYGDDFFFCKDELQATDDELENPAHALFMGLPFKGEAIGSLKSEVAGKLLVDKVKSIFAAVV